MWCSTIGICKPCPLKITDGDKFEITSTFGAAQRTEGSIVVKMVLHLGAYIEESIMTPKLSGYRATPAYILSCVSVHLFIVGKASLFAQHN